MNRLGVGTFSLEELLHFSRLTRRDKWPVNIAHL